MDRRRIGQLLTRQMEEIRREFAELLAKRLGRSAQEIREDGLGAGDFSTREEVELTLPDGSVLRLRYAFAVVDEAVGAVAVFSEHCGYYVFCGPDLRLTLYRDDRVVSTRAI